MSLHALLIHDLKTLFDAEHQLAEVLPKLAIEARTKALKDAFTQHAVETKNQIERLREVFATLDEEPERIACLGMKGLLAEGMRTVQDMNEDNQAHDAALIGSAMKVEHLEMGAYESAWMLAQSMDHDEAASLLEDIREQEEKTERTLAKVGKKVSGMTLGQKIKGAMH